MYFDVVSHRKLTEWFRACEKLRDQIEYYFDDNTDRLMFVQQGKAERVNQQVFVLPDDGSELFLIQRDGSVRTNYKVLKTGQSASDSASYTSRCVLWMIVRMNQSV